VENSGLIKRITPRPRILENESALVIVSNLDQKIYNFTGEKASEDKQTAALELAQELSVKYDFIVEKIEFPAEKVASEHLQFIEYFIDERSLPNGVLDTSKYYKCYFCEGQIDINANKCTSCGREIMECFVCNFPILLGDIIGKCSLCGATAHLVHFYEWLKALGMCAKCNQKLHPEGIIPIIDEMKEQFFDFEGLEE